jgi:hypothetical protein
VEKLLTICTRKVLQAEIIALGMRIRMEFGDDEKKMRKERKWRRKKLHTGFATGISSTRFVSWE